MIVLLIVGCLIAGGALMYLVMMVTKERHPEGDGEQALQELRRSYYGDVKREKK